MLHGLHKLFDMDYTNFLTYQRKETDDRKVFPEAYKLFCEDTVQERIIEGGQVLRLTKLCALFQQKIKRIYNEDVIIKSQHLKERLLRDFSQLTPGFLGCALERDASSRVLQQSFCSLHQLVSV